ncbi:hypothetical protein PV11_01043 [Exophiala sideris]|uniref:Putative zinc-finger domain-containing protein n=1 Tax=Exophiala sideris TaxID=1016849 RepID=A0A0D1W941_9EURO|nr:hypothetical protein PV11_01043 [Exophiala sideris]
MAHPFSSNPFYAGTPSYAPQQPHYPFPPNGLQQQAIHTPPGLNQQHSQPPSYQPSPVAASAPRYDTSSQIRTPFPPFPPPPTTLGADFFKQFANAGLPPPPPPSLPPVPLPNVAGYPQFPAPVNTGVSSPYRPQTASAPLSHGSGFGKQEQSRHNFQELATAPQPERDSRNQYALHERPSHNYASYNVNQGGKTQPARGQPSKADTGKEESLPSFGSRSDLELLFATAQQQQATQVNDYNMGNSYSSARANETTEQPSQQAGSVSPYDPTRPATVGDRPSGGFGLARDKSNDKSKSMPSKTFERTYDNKSPTELRQLAKGALLSLVPHKILYADLVKEGVDPQVLKALYGELGIKADVDATQLNEDVDATPLVSGVTESGNLTDFVASGNVALAQPPQDGIVPTQALLEVKKQQPAVSPNLERKDRIAQLLAAKAGRPTLTTPASDSLSHTEGGLPAASAVRTVHTPRSAPRSPVQAESDVDQRLQSTTTAKAQPDVIKAKMEQLKRESEAKGQKQLSQTQMASGLLPGIAVAAPAKPIFGSASQIQGRLPASAITSMIPGLFMTPSELASMDEAEALEDSEMVDAPEKEQGQIESSLSASGPASQGVSIPQKRPLFFDPALASTEPQAKRTHVEIATEGPEVDTDEQSEGEIIEGAESDSAAGLESQPQRQETLADSETQTLKPDALATAQNNLANEAGKEELYRAKQTEIEAMRRKIAELEQRNKLKRRSQIESPASSNPATPLITRREAPLSSSPIPQSSASGLTGIPSKQSVARTIAKLTPAQLAERTAALKADLLRQRAQRQQVLQDGLPDLNFEVSKIEVRLTTARQELNEAESRVLNCQSALEQAMKARDDLSEETAQLERQLQEGQSGQKQYADELQQLNLERLAEAQASTTQGAADTVRIPETLPDAAGLVNNESHIPAEEPEKPSTASAAPTGEELPIDLDDSNAQLTMPGVEAGEVDLSQPPPGYQVPISGGPAASPEELEDEEAEEDVLESGLARADTFQTDEMEISPEPDSEPEPAIEEVPDVVSEPELEQSMDDTPMNVDDDSDGSASMSDSDDEQEQDYEPAETHISHDQPGEESDEYDPEEAPVTQDATPNTGMDNDEEDFYEPSENVEDLSAQPSPDVQQEPAEAPEAVSEVPLDNPEDDIESGPQLTEPDTLVKTQGAPNGDTSEDKPYLDGNSASAPRFVPYKTPLSAFKTFRFHQDYNDTVKSGYRSLTYSNNIDPSRPLCPTELSGESCSDPTCEEQHFRQIGLPDDKILVQMSSASDIKDKTTRDEFLVGLKHVIADLRSNDVKDFDSVAGALSNYRRKFFAEREEIP